MGEEGNVKARAARREQKWPGNLVPVGTLDKPERDYPNPNNSYWPEKDGDRIGWRERSIRRSSDQRLESFGASHVPLLERCFVPTDGFRVVGPLVLAVACSRRGRCIRIPSYELLLGRLPPLIGIAEESIRMAPREHQNVVLDKISM